MADCHLDADDYGKKAVETAKIMKWEDDSIQFVVCGSATTLQQTYPDGTARLWNIPMTMPITFLCTATMKMKAMLLTFWLVLWIWTTSFTFWRNSGLCEGTETRDKGHLLFFDEWNVWYQQKQQPHPWMEAPEILEDHYTLLDALVVAGMSMTLLNHADRVKIACLAQLVNVIAPIFTEKGGRVMKQSIFYPFAFMSKYGRGVVLKPVTTAPKAESRYGETPLLQQSVVYNEQEKAVNVFALNIGNEEMKLDWTYVPLAKLQCRNISVWQVT